MTNFLNETNNLTVATVATEVQDADISLKPVVLRFGTEEVEVVENLTGTTDSIITLVKRYEEELGIDAARITSFRHSGQVVSGEDRAVPGAVYSLSISAESKGH